MSIKEKEEMMVKAGEVLGELMSKADDKQKEIMLVIMEQVEKYAAEMEAKGKCIDKSSMYATAILLDDNLNPNDELVNAAKHYIDADYDYIMSLKEIAKTAE